MRKLCAVSLKTYLYLEKLERKDGKGEGRGREGETEGRKEGGEERMKRERDCER